MAFIKTQQPLITISGCGRITAHVQPLAPDACHDDCLCPLCVLGDSAHSPFLLGCPFCGNPAVLHEAETIYIECIQCGADGGDHRTVASAAQHWNGRTGQSADIARAMSVIQKQRQLIASLRDKNHDKTNH